MAGVGTVQTVIVAAIVLSSGFRQDDYLFFWVGREEGFSIASLTHSVFGSLIPGFMFVNILLGQAVPVPRWELVAITLALYVAIIFVLYRLLELLFGPRPGIVLLTAIATCSGLLGVSLVWWTPAINSLPAIVADLLALDGLARHALTGRRRYLVLSVVSFAVGIAFYDPSIEVVVPLALFVLLYLSDVRDLRSLWIAIRVRAWLWLGYAAPILVSLTWRAAHPSEYGEPPVASASRLVQFILGGWAKGFVSSSIGVSYSTIGNWWWEVLLAQIAFVGLVIVTIVRRRSAWRAWVLFFVSFGVTDLIAAVGRASLASYFQENSLYWCFSIFLLMISLGLALFPSSLPTTGVASPINQRFGGPIRAKKLKASHLAAIGTTVAVCVAGALCVAGIRYMWMTPDRATGASNRIYLDHVQASWNKVSTGQPTSFVWDTSVPAYVMEPWFSPSNRVATTVALVVGHLRVDSLDGKGYVINANGELVPAEPKVISQGAIATTGRNSPEDGVCFDKQPRRSTLLLPLTPSLPAGDWFIHVRYTQSTGVTVNPYANGEQVFRIPRGSGTVLAPLTIPKRTRSLPLEIPRNSSACLDVQIEEPVPG